MTTITQVITALPATPDPATDTPTAFSTKAAASVLAQKLMVTELQTWTTQVNTVKAEVDTAAASAPAAAGAAAASATTATAQAAIATTSAANASAALRDVQAIYDQFDDRYLGAKTADPTLDNDGNALADGAFYVNTAMTPPAVRIYTLSGGWVQGIASVAGVSSVNGATGAVTLKTVNGVALQGTGNITVGLSRIEVTVTSQTCVTGNDYWAENGAATAFTAPASTDMNRFAVTPANGLMTNTIDFGGATVRGPAGTMTGVLTLNQGLRMEFLYSSTLAKWMVLS